MPFEEAWELIHAATLPGWFVGRPGQRHDGHWEQYMADMTERAVMGHRSREWTAVGDTEEACLREMARCLREIGEGRVPK